MAVAQPGTLTLQRKPERAGDLVRRVAMRTRTPLRIDPELADRVVLVRIERVPRGAAADAVAELLGGELVTAGDGVDVIRPKWKAALLRKLEERPQKEQTAARRIDLAWLRAVTGLGFFVDPQAPLPSAELDPAGLKTREILDHLAEKSQLAWDLRWGVVFFAGRARLDALPVALRLDGLPEKKGALPFRATPSKAAAGYLKALYGVGIDVAAEVDTKVTAQVNGVTLAQALAMITLPHGLEAVRERGRISIRKARTVSFDVRDRPLREVVEKAFDGLPVEVDPRYAGKKVTARSAARPVAQALEALAQGVGGRAFRRPSGAWAIVPAWKRSLLIKLEREAAVKLDTIDPAALRPLLREISRRCGVPVVLDPDVRSPPDVEIHVEDVSGAQALALLTDPGELAWDLRWGAVFVATPERLAELPAVHPLRDKGLPAREIDLPFDDTPLTLAFQFVKAASGVTVEPAKGHADEVGAFDVTLIVSQVEVADALALMLLPLGFTADVEDGKVLVRWRDP